MKQLLAGALLLLVGCSANRAVPPNAAHPAVLCGVPEENRSAVEVLREPNVRLLWPTAHRGDRNSGPDNTAPAIRAAASYGVPLIESDIQISTDGSFFLFHDHSLKTTNVNAPPELIGRYVRTLSDDEIRHIQSNFAPSNPPAPMLFLKEALQILAESKTAMQLDLKLKDKSVLSKLVEVARSVNAADHIIFQCQSLEALKMVREEFPDIAVLARVHTTADIEPMLAYHPEMVLSDFNFFSPELIARIHQAGSKVSEKAMGVELDTIENWRARFAAGIDIIMTDHGNKMMHFIRTELCK